MPRVQAVDAKNRPLRSTRHDLETGDQPTGQDRPRKMKSRGPARKSLDPVIIQAVDNPVSRGKMELLAFMEEPVTVVVHESTNPTDEPMPCVWNDGKPQRFMRGQEMTVKRKYIEVLARQKKTTYTQRKEKDENGDDTYIQVPHTALLYPFAVVNDTQKGRDWLKSIMQEA